VAELSPHTAARHGAIGVILARLLRLDPAAVVRLHRLDRDADVAGSGADVAGSGAIRASDAAAGPLGVPVRLWAHLPFDVLVSCVVGLPWPSAERGAELAEDRTVAAAALLAALDCGGPLPPPTVWRGALPPSATAAVEYLPADDVRRVAAAAEATVREALTAGVSGRAVGERRLRDAMLRHVPFRIDNPGGLMEVPQRLVQGVVRMGFVDDTEVAVHRTRSWLGLRTRRGSCWYRSVGDRLGLRVVAYRPNG
jgi:hypothetical protein